MNEHQRTDVATAAEAARLAEIRRLQNWIWGWPVAGLAIIFVAGSVRPEYGLVAFFILAVVFFVLTGRHLLVRCPRCQQYFNWRNEGPSRRHQLADACVHCGLQRDARRQGQ
jgi:hypothetical protein